jgi:hypothetical protein
MSEVKITNKQLRAVARACGIKLRRQRGVWEILNCPLPTGEWKMAGWTNSQCAQYLADLLVADHEVESLLARAANCN